MHLEADDFRNEHRYRLSEHRCFGFDSTNAPAEHAEAVDHGGVRIGAYEAIRVSVGLLAHDFGKNPFGQILEIDLVNNARIRRHNTKIV